MTEEIALGGNLSDAVRVGDTVRRRAGAWTPAVHALLRHLEAVGFEGSPRVVGTDEQGREVLAYIEGDGPTGWPDPMPQYVWRDTNLIAAARLLRRYHDAQTGFTPPVPASWRWPSGRLRQRRTGTPHLGRCDGDLALGADQGRH